MFFKKSRQIKELKKSLELSKAELNRYYGKNASETIYMDKYLEAKRELETLKFKLNQKEDLGEVISQIRKLYLSNFDKDLHKQYVELVKLYNRIGE